MSSELPPGHHTVRCRSSWRRQSTDSSNSIHPCLLPNKNPPDSGIPPSAHNRPCCRCGKSGREPIPPCRLPEFPLPPPEPFRHRSGYGLQSAFRQGRIHGLPPAALSALPRSYRAHTPAQRRSLRIRLPALLEGRLRFSSVLRRMSVHNGSQTRACHENMYTRQASQH